MAYYPLTPFIPQFLDSSGNPLSGGTLTVYLAGTTTASTLYTDDTGTSTGSTITINSSGYPSVSGNAVLLYGEGSTAYKFVLKNSAGATIYTVDDVDAFGSFTTVQTKLGRFVSRFDYATDESFAAVGTDASVKLNQIDIYKSASNWAQLITGDRGVVLRSNVDDSRVTFNVIPTGTVAGTNTSYGTIRVWGQDIEADPNGSRTSINMEMHYDSDEALRCRLATRSEGTPALPHPDFYWQVNGSNCLYVGRKKDGTTGRTNWGVFPRGYAFVTSVTDFWAASEVVVAGDKRLIAKSDYLYLECTTGGTTGSSEPTPTNAGTSSLSDGTAVWDVKSRLYLAGSTEATSAIPAIWGNEDGNTGFGTLNPQAGYHFASAARFDAGIDFTNASVTGARLKNILSATVSTNFGGTVTAGGVQTASVTVTGAAVGDCVILGMDVDNMLQGLVFQAYVDSTDSVTIQCQNFNASTRNPTTKTYRVTVLKY